MPKSTTSVAGTHKKHQPEEAYKSGDQTNPDRTGKSPLLGQSDHKGTGAISGKINGSQRRAYLVRVKRDNHRLQKGEQGVDCPSYTSG